MSAGEQHVTTAAASPWHVRFRHQIGPRRLECPCCGGRYRRFLTAGSTNRPNAMCPGCGSFERHRHAWLVLSERLAPTARVMHVEPEPPIERRLRTMTGLDYVTTDLEDERVTVRADLMALPFDDASFDVVICNHVLEHVPDDATCLREIRRVLRPDGWAMLSVPIFLDRETTDDDPTVTDPAERLERYGQDDHARAYGRDFPDRVAAAGFDVRVESPPADATGPYGLLPHRDLYLATPR